MYATQRLVSNEQEREQVPRRYDAWRSCERTPRVPATESSAFGGGSANEITLICAMFGFVQHSNYTGLIERPDGSRDQHNPAVGLGLQFSFKPCGIPH